MLTIIGIVDSKVTNQILKEIAPVAKRFIAVTTQRIHVDLISQADSVNVFSEYGATGSSVILVTDQVVLKDGAITRFINDLVTAPSMSSSASPTMTARGSTQGNVSEDRKEPDRHNSSDRFDEPIDGGAIRSKDMSRDEARAASDNLNIGGANLPINLEDAFVATHESRSSNTSDAGSVAERLRARK